MDDYKKMINTVNSLLNDIDKVRTQSHYYCAVNLLQKKILQMLQNGRTSVAMDEGMMEGHIPCGDTEYSHGQFVTLMTKYLDENKKYGNNFAIKLEVNTAIIYMKEKIHGQ